LLGLFTEIDRTAKEILPVHYYKLSLHTSDDKLNFNKNDKENLETPFRIK